MNGMQKREFSVAIPSITVAETVRGRETEVLNYFIHRSANVFAKSLNARIKSLFL